MVQSQLSGERFVDNSFSHRGVLTFIKPHSGAGQEEHSRSPSPIGGIHRHMGRVSPLHLPARTGSLSEALKSELAHEVDLFTKT